MLAQASRLRGMLASMRAARVLSVFLVPVAVVALIGVLAGFGVLQRADGRAWDRLLRLRAAAPAPRQVLLVDIDAQPGSFAGLLADGLVTFKEMDARSVMLVLPLAQKSPPSLDPSVLRQTLPNALDLEFAQIEENIQSLFDAIRHGSVRPKDSARFVSDLVGLVAKAKDRLSGAAMGIERDDDALLGQASAFFGDVYVPLELLDAPDPTVTADLADLALQRQSLSVLVTGADPSAPAAGIRPAVLPVLRAARGGGFLDGEADRDGVRRRMLLLAEHEGQHVGQIAFVASLGLLGLGQPAIEASPGRLILRGTTPSGGPAPSRTVPLTESGEILLAWPRAASGDGFRHLSWSTVTMAHQLENALVSDLRDLDAKGYLSYLRSPESLLDVYEDGARLRRGMLASGTDTEAAPWRETRERFFDLCDQFLNGDSPARIVEDADRRLQSDALSDEEKNIVRAERDRVPGAFDEARQVLARLKATRDALRASLAGSWCIVSMEPGEGEAVTAVTPFGAPASPALASAALLSTLVNGRFLREAPPRDALLAAAVLSLAMAAAVLRLKPLLNLLAGLGAAAVSAAVLGLVFTIDGLFVPPALPLASLLASAMCLSLLKMGWERADSRVVRAAFSGRVSTETMRDITAGHPPLDLDGALRTVTVVSLRQAGSAVSSSESPAEVVRRLRTHREAIAEAVQGLGGMLLEAGPRLSAVFGAPREREDHARRACLAALRVREMEQRLNEPASGGFSSRIGIHTGECVAGLLRPGGLPVYEMAGIAPEAAASLEALNESFSTSILVSEEVREAAGAGFPVRVLGSLPVAGQRMRVLELLAERDPASPAPADLIAEFEEGVARFEHGEIAAAFTKFTQVLARSPSDGPSAAYARRCRLLLDHPGLAADSLPWGPA